jgi:hypothetical protein
MRSESPMMACDQVLGCGLCAKPAALVGDLIPVDPKLQAAMLCPWCLAGLRPGVVNAWRAEADRERYDQRRARELWPEWPEEDRSL